MSESNTHTPALESIGTQIGSYLRACKAAAACQLAHSDYTQHHESDPFAEGLRIALDYAQERASALRRDLLESMRVIAPSDRETPFTSDSGDVVIFNPFFSMFKPVAG